MATQKDMKRLEQVLEIFGADSDRWPVSERAELEALIEHDDQARRLIGEAHALSSLMFLWTFFLVHNDACQRSYPVSLIRSCLRIST